MSFFVVFFVKKAFNFVRGVWIFTFKTFTPKRSNFKEKTSDGRNWMISKSVFGLF